MDQSKSICFMSSRLGLKRARRSAATFAPVENPRGFGGSRRASPKTTGYWFKASTFRLTKQGRDQPARPAGDYLVQLRSCFANTFTQQVEWTTYRNQLHLELDQQNNWLAELKAHPTEPQMMQHIDDDAQACNYESDRAIGNLAQDLLMAEEQ